LQLTLRGLIARVAATRGKPQNEREAAAHTERRKTCERDDDRSCIRISGNELNAGTGESVILQLLIKPECLHPFNIKAVFKSLEVV
jgi:hypothetical protein